MKNRDRLATTEPDEDAVLVETLRHLLGRLASRHPGGYLFVKAEVHDGEVTRLDLHSRTRLADGQYLFTSQFVSRHPDYVCFDD